MFSRCVLDVFSMCSRRFLRVLSVFFRCSFDVLSPFSLDVFSFSPSTATTTHDRLEALLNSTTDEAKVESVYKEISSSTVRYITLLHRVNGALDIQRWILGGK